MKFVYESYETFIKKIGNRELILFGASSAWHYYLTSFPGIEKTVLEKTSFIVDNNKDKQETSFLINDKRYQILNPEILKEKTNYIILITVSLAYQESICEQLLDMNLPDETECYSLPLMIYNNQRADNSYTDVYFSKHGDKKIPAKIHSFWFSGEEKPDLYKKCLDSWHKYCPDFEIIEWNANNYDVTKNRYMFEAFEKRKWAFVSDYARLDILYQYGGIYMDMDVELLASLDWLLKADSFFCRQEDGILELGSGFGVQANNNFVKQMLDTYENRKLILENGEIDKTPQPEWLSEIYEKNGFGKNYNSQIVGDTIVLSNDYITCATSGDPTQTAKLGVHWHNGSWLDDKDRMLIKQSHEAKDIIIKKYFNFKE